MNYSIRWTLVLAGIIFSSSALAQQPPLVELPQPGAVTVPGPGATLVTQPAIVPKAPAQAAQAPAKDPEKFNTKLPVEITSDSLEVLQHENKAIFRGNVVAVQGEVRLKSDVMTVHYKQKGGQETQAQPQQPEAQGGDMGAITKIDVEGNVLMATPQESAKGDRGDYEVATRIIHLYGDNVVLTRDKNIMRGTELEYNLNTGRSILANGKSAGTRVRSVFVPNQEETPKSAGSKAP